MATEGSGGDWDRRNRLKVYRALSNLLARDIKESASLLVDCIATFSCNEICSYQDFIVYTILSNVLHIPRPLLKEKIIDGPEILSVATDIPIVVRKWCLYDCGLPFKCFFVSHLKIILCNINQWTTNQRTPCNNIYSTDRIDQIVVRVQLQSLPQCHGRVRRYSFCRSVPFPSHCLLDAGIAHFGLQTVLGRLPICYPGGYGRGLWGVY